MEHKHHGSRNPQEATPFSTPIERKRPSLRTLAEIGTHHGRAPQPVAGAAAAVTTLQRSTALVPEESYVVAPGVVRDKRRACFARAWHEATAPDLFSIAA